MRRLTVVLLAGVCAAAVAGDVRADSPPVGPLPSGPTAAIQTTRGHLVAVALPQRNGGRVWRIARKYDARVVRQVSEADVGSSVVVVFRAVASGRTKITFALTRGETTRALEARHFVVRVR